MKSVDEIDVFLASTAIASHYTSDATWVVLVIDQLDLLDRLVLLIHQILQVPFFLYEPIYITTLSHERFSQLLAISL